MNCTITIFIIWWEEILWVEYYWTPPIWLMIYRGFQVVNIFCGFSRSGIVFLRGLVWLSDQVGKWSRDQVRSPAFSELGVIVTVFPHSLQGFRSTYFVYSEKTKYIHLLNISLMPCFAKNPLLYFVYSLNSPICNLPECPEVWLLTDSVQEKMWFLIFYVKHLICCVISRSLLS